MNLVSKEMFFRSPGKGTLVYGNSFYTRGDGVEKMRIWSDETRSDTADNMERSFSDDNGRTRSDPEEIEFIFKNADGTRREYQQPGFVEPETGLMLSIVIEGTLPNDDPMEGMKHWTYTDGTNFFSPSSCSQLLHHSNGKYYWLGNITGDNPQGNLPRYPLVIGQVDPETLGLIKDSILVIDDKGPQDDVSLTLSNFMAHDDRVSSEIILHMSRWNISEWIGDAYIYRIAID